ncbi:hypothetical protein GCM10028773_34090 [Spirosoma koreense]
MLSGGCNKVNDIQPNEQEGEVPVSAIEAVTGQFPQAKDMVFKTLEKNRVWQVAFSQNAARYSAATDQQLLLVAYQLADRSVPDSLTSLVRSTVIDGGSFSNLKVQNYSWFKDPANNGQFILADYDWRGTSYTFRWTVTNISGRINYVTEMFPYYQLEYRTVTLADLPTTIQESLRNLRADFNYAIIQVDGHAKKRYSVTVQQASNVIALTYNDEGGLTAVSNPQTTQYFSQTSQLPTAIQAYLRDTPELAGFGLGGQFTLLARSTFDTMETYTVNLQKGRETWFMTFNGKGELMTRSYLNLV